MSAPVASFVNTVSQSGAVPLPPAADESTPATSPCGTENVHETLMEPEFIQMVQDVLAGEPAPVTPATSIPPAADASNAPNTASANHGTGEGHGADGPAVLEVNSGDNDNDNDNDNDSLFGVEEDANKDDNDSLSGGKEKENEGDHSPFCGDGCAVNTVDSDGQASSPADGPLSDDFMDLVNDLEVNMAQAQESVQDSQPAQGNSAADAGLPEDFADLLKNLEVDMTQGQEAAQASQPAQGNSAVDAGVPAALMDNVNGREVGMTDNVAREAQPAQKEASPASSVFSSSSASRTSTPPTSIEPSPQVTPDAATKATVLQPSTAAPPAVALPTGLLLPMGNGNSFTAGQPSCVNPALLHINGPPAPLPLLSVTQGSGLHASVKEPVNANTGVLLPMGSGNGFTPGQPTCANPGALLLNNGTPAPLPSLSLPQGSGVPAPIKEPVNTNTGMLLPMGNGNSFTPVQPSCVNPALLLNNGTPAPLPSLSLPQGSSVPAPIKEPVNAETTGKRKRNGTNKAATASATPSSEGSPSPNKDKTQDAAPPAKKKKKSGAQNRKEAKEKIRLNEEYQRNIAAGVPPEQLTKPPAMPRQRGQKKTADTAPVSEQPRPFCRVAPSEDTLSNIPARFSNQATDEWTKVKGYAGPACVNMFLSART